jgi:hypothetical protein
MQVCRKLIMMELGRLEDPDVIRHAAGFLCDQKMRTREAVVRLRFLRAVLEDQSDPCCAD